MSPVMGDIKGTKAFWGNSWRWCIEIIQIEHSPGFTYICLDISIWVLRLKGQCKRKEKCVEEKGWMFHDKGKIR